MSVVAGHANARGAATMDRLLDATSSILSAEGASRVSVQRVATEAGTSKGLVHYHFPDKESLLVACADRLTGELIAAEEAALRASTAATVLDDLWGSFVSFAQRGSHRALIALATETTEPTRAALAAAIARRHLAAERTLGRVVDLLGFAPPVSRGSLAAAYVGLTDGLALDIAVRPDRDHRPAFDAFWLAVLSLGTT